MLREAGFYSLFSTSSAIQKLSEPCHLGTLWRPGYICLRDGSNDHWWLTWLPQSQPVFLCRAEQGQTEEHSGLLIMELVSMESLAAMFSGVTASAETRVWLEEAY